MAFHKFSNATLKHFCLWIMMCSLSLYQRYLKYQAHFRGGIWKLPLFKTDKIPRITSKIFKKKSWSYQILRIYTANALLYIEHISLQWLSFYFKLFSEASWWQPKSCSNSKNLLREFFPIMHIFFRQFTRAKNKIKSFNEFFSFYYFQRYPKSGPNPAQRTKPNISWSKVLLSGFGRLGQTKSSCQRHWGFCSGCHHCGTRIKENTW